MRLNADFSKRVIIDTTTLAWEASPMPGVERRKLDRIGDEVARATTLVKYAPNSAFDPHSHDGGEEFFVLDGVFSDEHGDYPAGTYVRNPIGTRHTPHSDDGCIIFVKLQQFDPGDSKQFAINTNTAPFQPSAQPGVSFLPLHSYDSEQVTLIQCAPGTSFTAPHTPGNSASGEEILVLDGAFSDENGHYAKGTWLRSPHISADRRASDAGCLTYVKTGHLGGGN